VPISPATLQPGDVVVTATDDLGGWFIRLRSKLQHRPSLHNHVALFVHCDSTGRPRGVEGRPSGFGWVNLESYLNHPGTVTNADQPLSDEQRDHITRGAAAMVGIPYDWQAILAFAAGTAGIPFLPAEWPEDGVPSHVVCSSAADYLYEGAHAANPGGYRSTRRTDPDDWSAFIASKGWLT
jgi:hypothetical protein